MSNTENLKNYLLTKENPFLLDDTNNGKTIMLSGAWGAGKTYFWKNEIEKELVTELEKKEKACVYVSLYGKDSLDSLKKEIYLSAFSKNELISKEVSAFGIDALSSIKDSDLAIGKTLKAFSDINKYRKSNKGVNRLKDGGVICLDDFERKSKKIDLNDLFGFISQLAIEMNCKIVIILNSDVFVGKEAEVFKRVKEKTVNKYFYFEPTIEELFKSIDSHEKYDDLDRHKDDILKAIIETEELNARIYMQVLDNCLEWEREKGLDKKIIRVLVLGSINFIVNHMVLYFLYNEYDEKKYNITLNLPTTVQTYINVGFTPREVEESMTILEEDFFDRLEMNVNKHSKIPRMSIWLENNKFHLKALWKYGYRLYYVADVDKDIYNEIANFIETGILIK